MAVFEGARVITITIADRLRALRAGRGGEGQYRVDIRHIRLLILILATNKPIRIRKQTTALFESSRHACAAKAIAEETLFVSCWSIGANGDVL